MNTNILYPRYTREEDGRCKLTNQGIADIRRLSQAGMTRAELSCRFGVSKTTIYYWVSEERRRKASSRKQVPRNRDRTRESQKKARGKNERLQGKALK